MKSIRSYLASCLALLASCTVSGQTSNGTLPNGYPQVNLFLHLDKSIYQPGETVWFTGYVLNRDKALKFEQNTLYAMLVDPINRKPVVKRRFVIEYGIGKGFLSLPGDLVAGNYWVLGYTNACLEHGKQPIFKQLISVRTRGADPFRISSIVLPPAGDDTFRVRYKVTTSYRGLAAGGKFEYTVFDDTNAVDSGSRTIDPFGEVVIPLDGKRTAGKDLQLTAKISRNGLTKGFILPVNTTGPALSGANRSGSGQDLMAANHGPNADFESPAGEPQSIVARLPANPEQPPANHIRSGAIVTIEPDSAEYHPRQRITLHIRVRDSLGKPLSAIFSLAVVSSKKLDSARMPSIADYIDQPDSIFVQPGGDVSPYAHPRRASDRLPDSGYVLYEGHSPHRAISLALMGNGFSTLMTDTAGRFQLPYEALVTPFDGVHYLSVTEKEVDRYKIVVCSKVDPIAWQLASTYHPIDVAIPDILDSDDLNLAFGAGVLQAAVVKARAMGEYNFLTGEFNSTHCETDYICSHHHSPSGFEPDFLNCPLVKFDSCHLEKPVEGRTYLYVRDTNRVRAGHGWNVPLYKVVYHCAVPCLPPFVKTLEPILREKPFPAQDSSSRITLGWGLQSTEYWEPAISIYNKDEVTVIFNSNNLTGKFTCRIQGLSTMGPISKCVSYTVRAPKD